MGQCWGVAEIDHEGADAGRRRCAGKGRKRCGAAISEAGGVAGRARGEILAVDQLPPEHRRRMRSTNLLERLSQEIKRRTRVIRIFANEEACARAWFRPGRWRGTWNGRRGCA